jgi:hypothetical protein
MKLIFTALLPMFCLTAAVNAGQDFSLDSVSASDVNSKTPAQQRALAAEENERIYQAGAAERARIAKEAAKYFKAEGKLQTPRSAFRSPTPAGIKTPDEYAALREKNAGFIRNVEYWRGQIKSAYPNLEEALKVNDISTADILLNHMRHDHWAIVSEIDAIHANNRSAESWPMELSNEELYNAGAQERAAILAQAGLYANLDGRDLPRNAFVSPTPAGTADAARYAELRDKNAGFISNIEYWRNQLTGNHANLVDDVKANDLKTSRILLEHMRKDSEALDNELKAVERNNEEAAKF